MSEEADFNEIINQNFGETPPDSAVDDLTIKDLHECIAVFAEAILYNTDFIKAYYAAVASDDGETQFPALTREAVFYLKSAFANAKDFNASVTDDDDDDDEDDE